MKQSTKCNTTIFEKKIINYMIQIIKTTRQKNEKTGMVVVYLLKIRRGGPKGNVACSPLVSLWIPGNIIESFIFQNHLTDILKCWGMVDEFTIFLKK